MNTKKYTWTQYNKNEWRLIRVHYGITLAHDVVATVHKNPHGYGWNGVVCSTRQHQVEVLFFEPDNLWDMKTLLETTVALRESLDGI